MKATFLYGAGDVRVVSVADPVIQQKTDAIVRVVRACVCGSDLHPFHTRKPGPVGAPMGHEMVGVVEEIGSEVSTVKRGDLVVATFTYQDNTCVFCQEGFHTSCVHGGFYNKPEVGGFQAEYARVPQADGSLVAVPGVDENSELLPSLLALSDVYLTGYHAAHMGRVGAGKTVTVIGDGAVGLSAVLASKRLGAERVILMGRHQSRTDLGREFGADEVVAERGEEGVARVRELTRGEGSHVVVEAVGHFPAYQQALGSVRVGGTISRVGVPQYSEAPIGWGSLFSRNITLTGGPAPVRAYIESALKDVLDGSIAPGRVFDRVIGIDEAAQGYSAMDSRESLKVMIAF